MSNANTNTNNSLNKDDTKSNSSSNKKEDIIASNTKQCHFTPLSPEHTASAIKVTPDKFDIAKTHTHKHTIAISDANTDTNDTLNKGDTKSNSSSNKKEHIIPEHTPLATKVMPDKFDIAKYDINRHAKKLLQLKPYLQDRVTKQWCSGWWEFVYDERDYQYLDYITEKRLKKIHARKATESSLKPGMLIDVGEQDDDNDVKYTEDTTEENNAKQPSKKPKL